jgi:KDO2-lipid IV(A) lauroyltransferase
MGFVLRALSSFVGWLPWRVLAPLGAVVGWVAGSVLRIRRGHVEEAMQVACIERPDRQARAMYGALGASALEFLWLAGRGEEAASHVHFDPAAEASWQRAVALGRGVVIAASHTGNWDLAACAMADHAVLLVVTKHLSMKSFDRFWQSTRAGRGVRLTGASGAWAEARHTLRDGGAVAMMIDQVPALARHGVAVEFLGKSALADRAPAALAAAAGAPLLVAATRRDARGEHILHVVETLVPPARPSRAWIDEATLAATRALDGFVRQYPSQWLWLHRRWKTVDRDARPTRLAAWPQKTRSRSPEGASRVV